MSEQTSVLITKECIEDVDLVALCEHYGIFWSSTSPHEDGVVLTFFNSRRASRAGSSPAFTWHHMSSTASASTTSATKSPAGRS